MAIHFAIVIGCALLCAGVVGAADLPRPVTKDRVDDAYQFPDLAQVRVEGMLGERMRVNLENRLLRVDEQAILAGYRNRPGSHAWIGEHVGKFLHAASYAWQYSHDDRPKTLMDRVAA